MRARHYLLVLAAAIAIAILAWAVLDGAKSHAPDIPSSGVPYGHLSSFAVAEGEPGRQGEVIGFGGDSGLQTSAHLHFEIRQDDSHLDPLLLLPQEVRDHSQARASAPD